MDMQDKEFDQVFRSKFDDLEVEPSSMVWGNITDELDGRRGKRAMLPYLSIAATILVVLTAGVLVLQKGAKPVDNKKPTKLVANRTEPAIIAPVKATTEPVAITKTTERVAATNGHQHNNTKTTVTTPAVPANNNPGTTGNIGEPVKTDNQPLIVAVKEPATTELKATVPGNDVQLAPKTLLTEMQPPVDRPVVMASADKQEEAPVKKHGIRSLGGLINVLVAKIDKRQDKIIEFGDADDDDDTQSKVTGVNLGLIKIKQQK